MFDEKTFLRAKEISALGHFSKSYVYQLVRKGLLPPPMKLGFISLWRKSDVEALIEKISKGVNRE